jgi:hypothetical protein
MIELAAASPLTLSFLVADEYDAVIGIAAPSLRGAVTAGFTAYAVRLRSRLVFVTGVTFQPARARSTS